VLIFVEAQRGVLPYSRSRACADRLEYRRIVKVDHRHSAFSGESAQNCRPANRSRPMQRDDGLLAHEISQDRRHPVVNHALQLFDHPFLLPAIRFPKY
jgi:hypothetical protein